jgi:hypothetical protein
MFHAVRVLWHLEGLNGLNILRKGVEEKMPEGVPVFDDCQEKSLGVITKK